MAMPFLDLRHFLEYLDTRGELLRINKPVDVKYEIAAYIRKTCDTGGPALLFEKVKGFDCPVVGGVFATRKRVLDCLGMSEADYALKFHDALNSLVSPRLVNSAPCKEVIYKGDEVDLRKLPVPIFSEKDSGPFITLGIVRSQDVTTGRKNTAIYRMEIKGKNRLGILSQDLFLQLQRAEAKNEALPVVITIGTGPVIPIASQWKAPFGIDELELAGALQGKPVETVRAESVDLDFPASAEIVIEGSVLPHQREVEGPFGEVSGYYTPASPKPVIEVVAITHRKTPLFQVALTGKPPTENHFIKQIPLEATFYWELRNRFPGVKAVHFPTSGAVGYLAIIAMQKNHEYEARNLIATMFGSLRNKFIIVVDEDVNIRDIDEVLWAVSTRCRPAEDVILFPRLSGSALDPSAQEPGASTGLGIDATRPRKEAFPDVVRIPGEDQVTLDVPARGGDTK
ncbi:MAG: UbiD family decarboxylase [Deltaproteobacteria bacterium]|nr:UbiD family decarboxylase [Deltaproteobacteria bacterium]